MANKNAGVVPIPMRGFVNKARKRKFAGNGEKKKYPSSFWLNDEMYKLHTKLYNNLTADQASRQARKPEGTFTRYGWSTPAERAAELSRAL